MPACARLTVEEPSLESVFLSLTGREIRDAAASARDRTLEFGRRGGEHTMMILARKGDAAPAAGMAMPAVLGVYAIWLREVKRAMRDRGQLVGGVSRPLLWVLVMGVGLNPYFRGEVYGEVRFVIPFTYVQFIFPAVIVLNIMYTSVQSAVSVIWDREFGFLREVLVSPMPRAADPARQGPGRRHRGDGARLARARARAFRRRLAVRRRHFRGALPSCSCWPSR